jgi:hypothetical protein
MADAELPLTWAGATRSALGNSLWILPLVAIERLVAGEFGQAAVLGLGWLVAIVVAVKLHVFQEIISSRERQRQLLTWALIIFGAVILGTGLYRLGARQASSGSQEITKTVVVHDPPTAEDIAKATGAFRAQLEGQISSLTSERDSYKQQVDQLRPLVPQAPPSIFVKSWQGFSVDEKARLRPVIGELSDIFDTKGAAAVRLESNLIQEVGDFQNPDDANSAIYDPVVLNQRLKELNHSVDELQSAIFVSFLPSHHSDEDDLRQITGDNKIIYELQQALSGLSSQLEYVKIIEDKSTDKIVVRRLAMTLVVPRYNEFGAASAKFNKWYEQRIQSLKDKRKELR